MKVFAFLHGWRKMAVHQDCRRVNPFCNRNWTTRRRQMTRSTIYIYTKQTHNRRDSLYAHTAKKKRTNKQHLWINAITSFSCCANHLIVMPLSLVECVFVCMISCLFFTVDTESHMYLKAMVDIAHQTMVKIAMVNRTNFIQLEMCKWIVDIDIYAV